MDKLKLSQVGCELIQHYESLHDGDLTEIGLQAKMDPIGIWTVGWGHALIYKGKFLKGLQNKEIAYAAYPNMGIDEANKLFLKDAKIREDQVNNLGIELSQNEFDALVSFVFNCGIGTLRNSILLPRIIARKNKEAVSDDMIHDAFLRHNRGSGKILLGLTYRRKTESELFINNKLTFFN
jgi:lysozyme